MSGATFIFIACISVILAVATVELDGPYARIRQAECQAEGKVWQYVGDACVRKEL